MVGRTMLAGKINGRGPRSVSLAQSGIKVAALMGVLASRNRVI